MSPSSGDALLCFVKRAVPERTKEKTGTAKAMAVVVGLSLRRMVNLTTRCPQRGKSNPAILTAAPFRGLPQRREHLASYGTTLCRGSINALIVAPWSLPRRQKGCQWPHSDWHSENMTTMRHAPGAIRLCWHCDNQLRDQFTERLESMATDNCARWVLSVVRRDLGFDDSHVVTMPELCWWLVRNDLADALPESAARKALRLPKPVVPSVTRESDLVPSVPATSIIQDKAKKVLALKVDPESPESFMLRPKRRRWVNEKYTRWVKTQPCACCGKPADDPHHLIGHGQGGMGTKAHDLFVLPLCRKHHDELHADTVAFEEKYGSQLELIFRFIDRALAIGVLA